ncbi:MAG: type II toxin-antitoxin system RelE/ParE family toxin [Acidobacteria bacterium]|nr:type II toxin-antitoxin system RelE/ParE family toxin [Acidobacteriota bacterium]
MGHRARFSPSIAAAGNRVEIVRRIDLLSELPEMGSTVLSRFLVLRKFRQIIIRRKFRVIYDFDPAEERIYILCLQNCRQKLPSARDLKRS